MLSEWIVNDVSLGDRFQAGFPDVPLPQDHQGAHSNLSPAPTYCIDSLQRALDSDLRCYDLSLNLRHSQICQSLVTKEGKERS